MTFLYAPVPLSELMEYINSGLEATQDTQDGEPQEKVDTTFIEMELPFAKAEDLISALQELLKAGLDITIKATLTFEIRDKLVDQAVEPAKV